MNVKPVLLILILLISTKLIAQKEVLNLPINYQSDFYKDKESLAFTNEDKDELVLYIEDYKKTKVVLLDTGFSVKSKFEVEPLPKSFKNYLGYQINKDGVYSLFFSNQTFKKFGRLDIDFRTKTSKVKTLDFKLNKEYFVESLTLNNNVYLISVTKKSNDVNFYTFDDKSVINKRTVSFDFLERKVNNFTKKASAFISGSPMTKIDVSLPNSIELTSNENKMYINQDELVFTFDNDHKNTIVAKLNPYTFEISYDEFKNSIVLNHQYAKQNSYIFDNKLFQVTGSYSQLKFTVKDLNNKELISDLTLNKSDSITFKNTPIIQEGGGFIGGQKRVLEETNKFLRKISRDKIGVSVYKQNNNFKIVLGGEVINKSGGSIPGFGGIPMGSVGPLSVSFNPTFFAYGNYTSSKSTYINCLFDENFTHVEGEIEEHCMDEVKNFEISFEPKNINAPKAKLTNVFSFKNKLYFGYVYTGDNNYHLVEFDK